MQAWMIARDSSSLASLIAAVKYESHPILWYLGLYAVTRFTHNPFAMQLCHILIATAAIWVFARFSPFTKLQKILFAFGYFPFYEYAIKSRGYALGILLLFLFCVFYKNRSKKYILLSCILFLLCQTSFLGMLIALSLQAMLIFEILSDDAFRQNVNKAAIVVMVAILLAGAIICIWRTAPPINSRFVEFNLQAEYHQLGRVISLPALSYFASPYHRFSHWDPDRFQDKTLFNYLCLSLALFLFLLILFLRKTKILFLYVCSIGALLLFFYAVYLGHIWHHGHLYILLIVCFWLSDSYPEKKLKIEFLDKLSVICKKYQTLLIMIILAINFYHGITAYVKDYYYSFSAAKEAAQFIRDSGLKDMLIAGESDFAVSPIAGYLDKKVYYLREGRLATYVKFGYPSYEAYDMKKIQEEPILQNKKSLLILNKDLKEPPNCMKKIKEFTRSMVGEEKYYLYIINLEK